MPVRSSSSSVLVWPTRAQVASSLRQRAEANARERSDLVRLGYFGSYAGGNWGVGSDLDLVAVVRGSRLPFAQRGVDWDLTPLPVSADLLVYTEAEWEKLTTAGGRFGRVLSEQVVWVVGTA
jgi:predicted nucleotidyltransferase